jgi:hypothetical protein
MSHLALSMDGRAASRNVQKEIRGFLDVAALAGSGSGMSIGALASAPCRAELVLGRLRSWLIVAACLATAGALPVRAQGDGETAGRPPQGAAAPTPTIEEFRKQEGPFDLGGQRFTVVLQMKRLARQGRAADPDFGETLATVEIKDPGGRVHFQTTFPYEVSGDRFVQTTAASTQLLRGSQGRGLLITYGVLPSTPLGGESWQVFGLFAGPPTAGRSGRLVPFSKPIFAEGQLITGTPGERIVETSQEPGLQGDVLRVRVWAGNFFVIIPLRILWFRNTIGPAWQCVKMTPRGPKPICPLSVEAERHPTEEMTFVRLRPEADEGMGVAQHVVVKRDSKVEFLGVETEVIWKENADGVGLGVSDDVWLKIRIDGREGWIHTQEDFQAIGLPQSG